MNGVTIIVQQKQKITYAVILLALLEGFCLLLMLTRTNRASAPEKNTNDTNIGIHDWIGDSSRKYKNIVADSTKEKKTKIMMARTIPSTFSF